ncbi:MAG: restriction endonuclease subunit S [Candidatus Blackburnbacteria bacterium]|nr:restriction endonuclease subunit S [Candidatus Blackburnbacteria bacterium]
MTSNTQYKQTEIGEVPEDWDVKKSSEVIEIISGGTPKTSINEYWNGNIPWLSVVDFNHDRKRVYESEKRISDEGLKNSSTNILKKGMLIISARGTVGVMAQLGRDMAFNQSCYGLDAKDGIISNEYLYYALKSRIEFIKQSTHGSVFSTITKDTFNNIYLPIPLPSEQQEIASTLTSLDDKIELNRRMNKTLEDMGKTLFKRWFVDFEFPNEKGKPYKSGGGEMVESEWGEIPKGWEVKSLDDTADFLNGIACQKYPAINEADAMPVIKIADLRGGFTQNSDKASSRIDKKYHVVNGDVLFSWSGSLEVCLWPYDDGILNQHLFRVTSENYPKWFYYHWILVHLLDFRTIASGKATTMGHIQRRHLTNAKVLVPDKPTLGLMSSIMQPLLEKIISNNREIAHLKSLRDSFLPRLMSGKIRVN